MQVLLEAAKRGLGLFDDSWAVGLWIFSTNLTGPGTPTTAKLVPIAPLPANRQVVLGALQSVQATRLGDTALYETILAGYKAMRDSWEPGRVNSLIMMTDGENDDPNGPDAGAVAARAGQAQGSQAAGAGHHDRVRAGRGAREPQADHRPDRRGRLRRSRPRQDRRNLRPGHRTR
jgi:hypothetical protein